MPADTFAREVGLTADAASCWATVTDVQKLVNWIDVLSDVEEHEHMRSYSALLTDRVGPFSLRADLDITVTDVVDGTSIALRAEGRDAQVDSRIFVEGRLALDETDTGVRLHVDGRYEVTGRVASFGGPMIRSKAERIIGSFFDGVVRELG